MSNETKKQVTSRRETGTLSADEVDELVDELSNLNGAWFDESAGEAIDSQIIHTLKGGVPTLIEHQNLPMPYVYPTLEGGLRLEWDLGNWEVEAEFERNQQILGLAFNLVTDEEQEFNIEWSSADWPIALSSFVVRFLDRRAFSRR